MKVLLTLMSCTILVLYSSSEPGFCQDKHEHKGPPFRGVDGSKRLEFFRVHASYLELMPLLAVEKVRTELGIGEDGIQDLIAFRDDLDKQFSQFQSKYRDRDADRDAIRSQELEAVKLASSKAEGLIKKLLPGEKLDRLLGLFVQLHGSTSVRNKLIATRIGVTDEAVQVLRDKIEQKQHDHMADSRAKFEEIFRSGYDPSRFSKVLQEFKQALNEDVSTLLSSDQKTALEKLKGAQFEFPENVFGRGFAGRGRFGPDGPPGHGPRPGRGSPQSPAGPEGNHQHPSEKERGSSGTEFVGKKIP